MPCLGEVDFVVADIVSLMRGFQHIGKDVSDMDKLREAFLNLCADDLSKFPTDVKVYSVRQTKEQLSFIPMGWLVAERASPLNSPLNYGARKSMFIRSDAGVASYEGVQAVLQASGSDVEKMKQILAKLKPQASMIVDLRIEVLRRVPWRRKLP